MPFNDLKRRKNREVSEIKGGKGSKKGKKGKKKGYHYGTEMLLFCLLFIANVMFVICSHSIKWVLNTSWKLGKIWIPRSDQQSMRQFCEIKTIIIDTTCEELNIELTLWEFFWTILTASWLLRCSQRPSDANIRNWSWGCSGCTVIDGTELSIGFLKGSRSLNFTCNGSRLNSAFFRYTSPIDLEICNSHVFLIRMKKQKKLKNS